MCVLCWIATTVSAALAASVLQVEYTLPPLSLPREPLMLVTAFFVLFLSYMVVSRVDLRLAGDKDKTAWAQLDT
jgi:hypothetical protein